MTSRAIPLKKGATIEDVLEAIAPLVAGLHRRAMTDLVLRLDDLDDPDAVDAILEAFDDSSTTWRAAVRRELAALVAEPKYACKRILPS